MPRNYWIVKQEPSTYSWTTFVAEGKTAWTGVRNFQARNNLRAMKKGDFVFFYHSGETKQIVGLATVEKEAYPDPTAKEGDWSCVELAPVRALKTPVPLSTLKSDRALKEMLVVRHSRISVSPLGEKEFARILELSGS